MRGLNRAFQRHTGETPLAYRQRVLATRAGIQQRTTAQSESALVIASINDPSGTVHYDTIGVINGMKNLPAAFTLGSRRAPGLAETIEALQKVVDERRLAAPVTRSAGDR